MCQFIDIFINSCLDTGRTEATGLGVCYAVRLYIHMSKYIYTSICRPKYIDEHFYKDLEYLNEHVYIHIPFIYTYA